MYDISQIPLPTLFFEGIELPRYSYYLDNAALLFRKDGLHDDIVDWFWVFVICIGRERSDVTTVILDYAVKLKARLEKTSTAELDELFTSLTLLHDPLRKAILYDWIQSLKVIEQICRDKHSRCSNTCSWYGVPSATGQKRG